MTCHLQLGGEHLTSGLSRQRSMPLCFSNPLHGLPGSLHGQQGGEARPRKWADVVESKCPHLTSASASPTCHSGHLTHPAALALPAQPTPTAQSLSPPPDGVMSEEDVFNHLFRKTTWGENGKTNLKGKGKANLNNTEQGPKVCFSIWMLISC